MIHGLKTWLRLQLPIRQPTAEMANLMERLDRQGRSADNLIESGKSLQYTLEKMADKL